MNQTRSSTAVGAVTDLHLTGKRIRRLALWGTILVLCALWLIPTIGLFVTSLRTDAAIRSVPWWVALTNPFDSASWSLQAYQDALNVFGQPVVTTLAVVIPAVVIPVLFAAYAAYGLTMLEFRGRFLVFALFVAMLMVPLQVAFIPLLKLWLALDMKGSWFAIWVTHAAFGTPIAVVILYGFISRLPRELVEAARSDGASHFQIFWNIVLPLASPAITAYAVFQFLWTWNDVLVALVFLGRDKVVVNVALLEILRQYGTNWQALASGAFMTMAIPLIVFFLMQRFVVRGLLGGAIKG